MENVPVTIIVKAPNQQFEDQTIRCEMSWTINRLKNYLSEVYPNKPKSEEQKLIYSGQLLTDTTVLKDILRQYEGQDTHTVHLVFTPKNRVLETSPSSSSSTQQRPKVITTPPSATPSSSSSPTIGTTNDGLRHRTNAGQTDNNSQQSSTTPTMTAPMFAGMMSASSQFPMFNQQQQLMAQQMAMQQTMQHIYMQYINQYMNFVQQSSNSNDTNQPIQNDATASTNTTTSSSSFVPIVPAAGVPFLQQQQQQFPQHIQQMNQNLFWQYQQQQAQFLQQQQQQAAAAAAAMPPVDGQNVAVGQQPRLAANIGQDGEENRDWLDLFYTTSRALVLVTLVCFYSSPFRCLIVTFFIVLYYIYYTYNMNQRQALADANINNNQPAADGAAAAAGAAGADAAAAQQPDEALFVPDAAAAVAAAEEAVADNNVVAPAEPPTAATNSDATIDIVAQEQNNRLPVIALIRTFILSFFASLLPETPL